MKYLKEAKELRQRIPIPLNEALRLLEKYSGNKELTVVEFNDTLATIEKQFKLDAINSVVEKTGSSLIEAEQALSECKLDIQRAISYLEEQAYDRKYIPSKHITKQGLEIFDEWLKYENHEGLNNVIDFEFETITTILSHIPELKVVERALRLAKQRKDEIFNGYFYDGDIENYLQYSNRFKQDQVYKQSEKDIANNMSKLERELSRHWRNLK